MTPGQKYFIENHLKIKKPDGSFGSIKLQPWQIDFLNKIEEAREKGLQLTILKGKYRYSWVFLKSVSDII